MIIIALTFVLFAVALFEKGFTHGMLLETGVFSGLPQTDLDGLTRTVPWPKPLTNDWIVSKCPSAVSKIDQAQSKERCPAPNRPRVACLVLRVESVGCSWRQGAGWEQSWLSI